MSRSIILGFLRVYSRGIELLSGHQARGERGHFPLRSTLISLMIHDDLGSRELIRLNKVTLRKPLKSYGYGT